MEPAETIPEYTARRGGMDSAGFDTSPAMFTAAEMADLAAALSVPALDRSRAGVRHLMSHPAVRALAGDPRLVAIARYFLQTDAVPFRATLFDKSPDSLEIGDGLELAIA